MCVVTGRRWLSLCVCSYREKVAQLVCVCVCVCVCSYKEKVAQPVCV